MSNENEQRVCTCTTPEYTIKLNKQGPPGLSGTEGEPGFSPEVSVFEDDDYGYRLSITTAEGNYITPNLRVNNVPTGGFATQVLTKLTDGNFDIGWTSIPTASSSRQGIIRTTTANSIWENTEEDNTAVTPYTLKATAILSEDVRLATKITQEAYDNIASKDPNTLYIIVEATT